ncbi:hypothetical protein JRQ81_009774 [Phrynocephalus forsythii]|uniref:Uncharacterized protein n=1 Tax=Phrynocephalus forsythii TaxID=171643 RepID=A0A9Q0XC56_9SAUR|nr:hypothetical protein JRQ81_009774 [Phrynocephalus forsythii]
MKTQRYIWTVPSPVRKAKENLLFWRQSILSYQPPGPGPGDASPHRPLPSELQRWQACQSQRGQAIKAGLFVPRQGAEGEAEPEPEPLRRAASPCEARVRFPGGANPPADFRRLAPKPSSPPGRSISAPRPPPRRPRRTASPLASDAASTTASFPGSTPL